jgi:hypothetical protein
MPEGGTIAEARKREAPFSLVSDTGIGMDKEVRKGCLNFSL